MGEGVSESGLDGGSLYIERRSGGGGRHPGGICEALAKPGQYRPQPGQALVDESNT